MSRSETTEALVLRTYDVGEADRYCILLTTEHGRIAARASGARRSGSKIGGVILPFRYVRVTLRQSSSGAWIVCGAQPCERDGCSTPDVPTFCALSEGVELLMQFLTEEGAVPHVFAATLAFFTAVPINPSCCITYSFALLHALGLLPDNASFETPLSPGVQNILAACRDGQCPAPEEKDMPTLLRLRDALLREHLQSRLRSENVIHTLLERLDRQQSPTVVAMAE